MPSPDPDSISWLRLAFAFVTLIALLGGFAVLMRHLAARGFRGFGIKANGRRLSLVETLPLDARHRAVILRCDDTEHLLLLGGEQSLVVSSPLPSADKKV